MSRSTRYFVVSLGVAMLANVAAIDSAGATPPYRGSARTSVNRNENFNSNVNVNRNVNVNVNNEGWHGGGCCYHPVATAVAATAAVAVTAAVIGSMVPKLPPACTAVIVNGLTYQQCGTTWYQPQFVGTTTSYVVVAAPR
jgi:hypothetical protein